MVLIFAAVSAYAVVMDKIIVKVNDEVILKSEVDEAVNLLVTQLKMAGKPANKSELKKMMTSRGEPLTDEEVEDMLNGLDVNQDGKISIDGE